MKSKFFLIIFIIFVVIIWFTYSGIFNTFYEQDEWMGLGHMMAEGMRMFTSSYSVFEMLTGSGRVIALPIISFFFRNYPFSIIPFAFFSLVFHTINSILAFILAYRILKNCFFALVASLFFAISSVSSQAIIWAAASTTTLPSTMFAFIAILTNFRFLETNKKRYLLLCICCAILSYLFKESGIFLFIFLPLMAVLLNKQKNNWLKIVLPYFPMGIYLFCIGIFRIYTLLFSSSQNGMVVTGTNNVFQKIVLHSFFYPLSSISQVFINQRDIFNFAFNFQKIFYPSISKIPQQQMIAELLVADMFSILFSLSIISLLVIFIKNHKTLLPQFIFTIVFIITTVLPFVFVDKANAYLESRYYYNSVLGGGLLLGIFSLMTRKKLHDLKIHSYLIYGILLIPLIIFFNYHVQSIRKEIYVKSVTAKERLSVLHQIQLLYPKIPQKVVFYITSDKSFVSSINPLPFQQGIGYTLLTLYYPTGTIPKKFLVENFLWNLDEEGYKEINQTGFGYFDNLSDLIQAVKEHKFNENSIIWLHYDSNLQKIVDKTSEFLLLISK
jgi:hypothetical protein